MTRPCIALLLALPLGVGCSRQAVSTTDGSSPAPDHGRLIVPEAAGPGREARVRDAPAPTACKQLVVVDQLLLGLPAATLSRASMPALAFDEKSGFGAVWLSESGTSPATTQLSFARVARDAAGAAPAGMPIGAAKKSFVPELRHQGAEFATLYASATGATTLARLDEQGKLIATAEGIGSPTQVSLAPYLGGYVVLYVNPLITELRFATFPAGGGVKDRLVHTGEALWLLWVTPSTGGWAATWGKRFALLDATGALLGQPTTVISKDMVSSTYTALPGDGSAVAYARSPDFVVELQRLDAQGKPVGAASPLGPASIGAALTRQIGLVWTGSGYVVTYPSTSSPAVQTAAQLLDGDGAAIGQPLLLPHCLVSSSSTGAAAFGGGRLAVATVDGLSGLPSTGICVTTLECR